MTFKAWLEAKEADLIRRFNQLADDSASVEEVEAMKEEIATVQVMLMSLT